MVVNQDSTAPLVIIYSFLSISLICSVSNMVIILSEKVLRNNIALIIFLMQLSSLGMTLINYTFYPQINPILCKVESSLFYGFMSTNFLLLAYLFLTIYRTLKKQGDILKKYNGMILLGLFVVPAGYSFISFESYTPCGYSQFDFYCGICSKDIPRVYRGLVSINYLLPSVLGLSMFVILGIYLKNLDISKLQKQQKVAIRIISIPAFNLFYLILDSIITTLINTTRTQDGLFYLYLMIDSMYCVVPLINLVFYSNFVYHWSIIMNEHQLKCCRWMICRSPSQDEDHLAIDASNDSNP